MVRWLDTLNPKKKSYFGSEVNIDGTRFAHGGSGIILSRAIMYEIAVIHNGTAAAWDFETKERCCGDLVLSLALQEHGTELQDVWPLMSGETHFDDAVRSRNTGILVSSGYEYASSLSCRHEGALEL